MAKLDHAKTHLDELQRLVSDYVTRAHELVEEESVDPRKVTLRLRLHEPIPQVLSLIVGDIVHNLRSSVDHLAYELARRHVGGDLSPDLEKLPAFPIRASMKAYDSFFRDRREVFGPREEKALRSIAPGVSFGRPAHVGVPGWTFESEAKNDLLWTLDQLWNIDKHRRLHVAVWFPGNAWWWIDQPANHEWRWAQPPFEAGSIVGELIVDRGTPRPPDINVTIQLRLAEPGVGYESMVVKLQQFHDYLRAIAMPTLWQVYESWDGDD